jgi:hypothetical protein
LGLSEFFAVNSCNRGLSYLALVREAQNRIGEAKEATQASLEICQTITPNAFKTGFGLHKMATFMQKEGNLEKALYVA